MRVLLKFDPWKNPYCPCPPKYSLNPYTGCGHACRYCYITSYIPNPFNPRLKDNIVKRLRIDLKTLPKGSIIAISYSSDPYTPPEGKIRIMPKILSLISLFDVKVLIATKGVLVLRDIDLIKKVGNVVSMTITTLDKSLAKKLEPNAPTPNARVRVLEKLVNNGVNVSLRIDPIFPGLTDDEKMIREIIEMASSLGIEHIVSSCYKVKPDNYRRMIGVFPEMEKLWHKLYWIDGEYIHGYRYLPFKLRYEILSIVRNLALKFKMKFNTCRDGLRFLDSPGAYCDASHLLEKRD